MFIICCICVYNSFQDVSLIIMITNWTSYCWGVMCDFLKGLSNPKQPSCKRSVRPPRNQCCCVKKDVKSKVAAKNGCDGRLKAKILVMTIQVNLCCLLHVSLRFSTKFTCIVVNKIFAFNLPSQPFLGHHFGFHTTAFLGGRILSLQLVGISNCLL